MRIFSIAVLLVAIGVVGFSSIQDENNSDWIEYLIERGNANTLLGVCQAISDLRAGSGRFNEPGELGFDSGVTAGLFVLEKFGYAEFKNNRFWELIPAKSEILESAFEQYCPQSPTSFQEESE